MPHTTNITNPFDDGAFDRLPFGQSIGYPLTRDYILINRSAIDGNLWSRYNRWFHRDVIEKSAEINNQPVEVDQTNRASRPIIEFEAGIKLFDFGTKNKTDVDLVDTFTSTSTQQLKVLLDTTLTTLIFLKVCEYFS